MNETENTVIPFSDSPPLSEGARMSHLLAPGLAGSGLVSGDHPKAMAICPVRTQ